MYNYTQNEELTQRRMRLFLNPLIILNEILHSLSLAVKAVLAKYVIYASSTMDFEMPVLLSNFTF